MADTSAETTHKWRPPTRWQLWLSCIIGVKTWRGVIARSRDNDVARFRDSVPRINTEMSSNYVTQGATRTRADGRVWERGHGRISISPFECAKEHFTWIYAAVNAYLCSWNVDCDTPPQTHFGTLQGPKLWWSLHASLELVVCQNAFAVEYSLRILWIPHLILTFN